MTAASVRLGLRENAAQFWLLVAINAFVGAMVGLERSTLPLVGRDAFGLAWGLVPLFLAAHSASVGQIGLVAAVYPAVWAAGQIATGHWSDTVGRKRLIVAGMLVQAAALAVLAASGGSVPMAVATAALLGLGTALVYPTLIAAMSDAVSPIDRAPVVGVYRFWRDMGYALGAVIAGAVADAAGFGGAIALVAGLTAASGVFVMFDMPAERTRFAGAADGRHAVA